MKIKPIMGGVKLRIIIDGTCLLWVLLPTVLVAQTFTEFCPNPFSGVTSSAFVFFDFDNDTNIDVLVTGESNTGNAIAELYKNDGSGQFLKVSNTAFVGVKNGDLAVSDVNGDGYVDVLITGTSGSDTAVTKLYLNNQNGLFIESEGSPFPQVKGGTVDFLDVNNDGYDDAFITGLDTISSVVGLYVNDGGGNFYEILGEPFLAVTYSSVACADVNQDNSIDICINGVSSLGIFTRFYINDGFGHFSEMSGLQQPGLFAGTIEFADINGDDFIDLLVNGESSTLLPFTKFYENDGTGHFTEITSQVACFCNVRLAAFAFSDTNNDGAKDLLISGLNMYFTTVGPQFSSVSSLYTNDGFGSFTLVNNTPFENLYNGSAVFADVNGDGYDDIMLSGLNYNDEAITKLYLNDGPIDPLDDLCSLNTVDFILFPNPTKPTAININYNAENVGRTEIKIYKENGSLVKKKNVYVQLGTQIINMEIAELSRGIYILELTQKNKREVAKFVVD